MRGILEEGTEYSVTIVDFDLRRLVVEAIIAGVLAYGISIGVETTTDLSGGPITVIIVIIAVYTVKAAAWVWETKIKNN